MNAQTKICAAFRTDIANGETASGASSIMWMPEGSHGINATRGGEPFQAVVTVGPDAVPKLNAVLHAMLSAADRGEGSKPYFDFNHDEEEASAWPTAFRWVEGKGVYADVEWSDVGKAAVNGKSYRYFSPAFHLDAANESGPFISPDLFCLGGLVNAPAFQRIHEVAAKHAAAAGKVHTLESELVAVRAQNTTLTADLEKATMRAAVARVDAELSETDDVAEDVRAMLAKNLLTDEPGTRALITSLKASHRRQTAIILGPAGTSETAPREAGYDAYMAKLQKARA